MSIELSNMQRHSVCIAGVMTAAITCGLWCGLAIAQQPSHDEPRSESELANDSPSPSQEAKGFWESANLTSRFQRQSAMFNFVGSADATLLHELLQQSEDVPSQQLRDEVQEIVTLRLASLDPVDALARLSELEDDRRAVLTQVVFEDWAHSNYEQAIEHAENLDDTGRQAALRGILGSLGDLSRRNMRIVAEWLNCADIANDVINETMARREVLDPDSALDEFLSGRDAEHILREDADIHLFEHISRSLIEKHGARAALRHVSRAIGSSPRRGRALNVFFDEMRKDAPELAVQLGVEMSRDNDELVGGGVVLGWAYIDPLKALDTSLSVQDVNQRNMLLQALPLSGSVEEIPEDVLELLGSYPDVDSGGVVSRAVNALARKSPDLAVQYFHLVQDEAKRLDLAKRVVETWSRFDVVSALNWVKTSSEISELRKNLIPLVLKELVYADVQLALKTSLEIDAAEFAVGPEAGVIEELAKTDMETAIGMLASTRNAETRLAASKSVAETLISDGESARVIEIGDGLSESDRDEYFQSLFGTWVWSDWTGLYESIDQLPTAEIQSTAAEALLASHNSRRGIRLDENQENVVNSLLSEDARAATRFNTDGPRDWEYVICPN